MGTTSESAVVKPELLAHVQGKHRQIPASECAACQRTNSDGERVFTSLREVCETFFPNAHAAKTCRCYPKPEREGILVIQPRSGRQIRVI